MEPTILVIDDSSFVHAYIKSLMTVKGYRVLSAYDWPEVREILRNETEISLCLIDIHLPGMRDGDELAKSLRIHSKLQAAKLVFYSASGEQSLAVKTKEIGLDGYIVKGDSDEEFVEALMQYLPVIEEDGTQSPQSTPIQAEKSPLESKQSNEVKERSGKRRKRNTSAWWKSLSKR